MKTVRCFALGAASVLCLAAQGTPAQPAPADQPPKNEQHRSLPPGPVGLQPLVSDPGKAEENGKVPPPDATNPNKMAAPANAASGPAGAKTPPATGVDTKNYVIGAEDILRIIVWGQASLSGEFTVRPDGRISMPLIGDIQASDRTPEQMATEVTQKLKDGKILLDPNVTVTVSAVHSKKFYIEGEVNRPGDYDLVVPTTVMEGLVKAGGFKDFANQKKIIILRDGGKTVLHFNYKEVSRGKHLEQNIYLQPGDHIIIH